MADFKLVYLLLFDIYLFAMFYKIYVTENPIIKSIFVVGMILGWMLLFLTFYLKKSLEELEERIKSSKKKG